MNYSAAHKVNISPVNVKRHLKWCKERRHWAVNNWKRVIWGDESLYHVAVGWEGLGVANARRTWYYNVGVFFHGMDLALL
jgi:hypothetical protein